MLTATARSRLTELAVKTNSMSPETIIVVGHSDATGSKANQVAMSIKRAEAVTSFLTILGVEVNRIHTVGKGAFLPVADNRTAEGRALNNRVEVEVVATRRAGSTVAPWRVNDQIPVLFATNRRPTGSANPFYFYGNDLVDRPDRDNLRRGIAVVKIPPMRDRGQVARPGWVSVTLERITSHPIAQAAGIQPRPAADPRTEFSFAGPIEEMAYGDFIQRVSGAISASQSKTAVLYVHGYANDFAGAAFRTAQIVFDLAQRDYDLVPLMFSWPSDPGGTGKDYDEARRRSELSGYDLARFLEEIAANTELGTVHLVAHSMGSEVLGHALLKLGVQKLGVERGNYERKPVFRQIVFAAPDVTPRIFEEVIEPAIVTRHMVTTYGASTDLALWISAIKNREERVGRVGASDRVPECVDTIDVTSVAKGGLAHSTWAESPRVLDDLRMLLRYGAAPDLRGLRERRIAQRPVWSMPAVHDSAREPAMYRPSPSLPVCARR